MYVVSTKYVLQTPSDGCETAGQAGNGQCRSPKRVYGFYGFSVDSVGLCVGFWGFFRCQNRERAPREEILTTYSVHGYSNINVKGDSPFG